MMCAFGHQLGEGRLVPGNPFRQHDAGVVRGLDDHTVQQIVDRHFAVDRHEHARRVRGRTAAPPGVDADVEFIARLELVLLEQVEHYLRRHQLGEARRRNEVVGGLFEQHAAALGFDENGVWRCGLKSFAALRT